MREWQLPIIISAELLVAIFFIFVVQGLYTIAKNQHEIMVHLELVDGELVPEEEVKDKRYQPTLDDQEAQQSKHYIDEVFYVESIDKTVIVLEEVKKGTYLCKDTDSETKYTLDKSQFLL